MEKVADVYARSLFGVAHEQHKSDEIRAELGQIADALDDNHDLRAFFFSPYFTPSEKTAELEKVFTGLDPLLHNFLALLIEKHRMPALTRIRVLFDGFADQEDGKLPVLITSATALDKATSDALGKRVGEQTGRNVQLTTAVDPEIIGGLVLQVGNQILDASIRTRLERLRRSVATGV
jgi:F-type H+-transporting ATPase subunit delta